MAVKSRPVLRKAPAKRRAAAKKTTRRAPKPRTTRRAARKAQRVAKKPKAPKRVARKAKAPKRKTTRKATRKTTRKATKKAPRKAKTARKARKRLAKKPRKPKRVTKKSQTGSRRKVWNGSCVYTTGGLTKIDLMVNPNGRLVSKKSRAHAEKNSSHIRKWIQALKQAKKEMGITGFVVINRTPQGIALYKRAKELHSA